MGQRGPLAAPRPLKILKGETRPSRLRTSPGPTEPPTRPDDLTLAAAEVWDATLAAITDTAHIGAAHAQVFRLYCETTATVNAMQPKGTKEWRELVNVHRQLARELCLTPATGTGLTRKVSPKRKLDKYVRAG
jgi:hypothetical protein